MLFNSFQFLVFFPIVTAGYFLLPMRFRWAWLLTASCWFYMAFIPAYILILGATIVIDYYAGLFIEQAPQEKKKRYLIISLVTNLGVLAFFKYANFIAENVRLVSGRVSEAPAWLNIILPIGLSFHTFQAMAYTIEVYRGHQKAERHFGTYALYVMFYPQLVAGPIERPQNILPQLKMEHRFRYDDVTNGLKLMTWGLFQKVVVADRLAAIVNSQFDHASQSHGLPATIAVIAFTFQIYLDFAGYSDIAIGAAQVMGIRLMTNFRSPFFSKSISEFWQRWHISLSTWFRDYLYIPLGGNRVSRPRLYANLMIVFLLSGLWHGASWNFVIWGAMHGTYLVSALLFAPLMSKVLTDFSKPWVRAFNMFWVFILVVIAFVFFRATTFDDAISILTHMNVDLFSGLHDFVTTGFIDLPRPKRDWLIALVGVIVIQLVHLLRGDGSAREWLAKRPVWVRWPAYITLVYSCVLFAVSGSTQFIYFQF